MAKWADDPEKAVGHLLDDVLEAWGHPGGVQLAVDLPPYVLRRPELEGAVAWSRRAERGFMRPKPSPWPQAAPAADGYVRAIVRLPRAKAEVDMTLSAVLARVRTGGDVWLVGGNDEGIKSGFTRLQECAGVEGDVLAQRAHGRIVRVASKGPPSRNRLEDWREVGSIDLGDGPRPWVHYPGTFNKGVLDEGTALLIEALGTLPPAQRVLDFAAGPGAVAAAILAREPEAQVTLLDNDALALEAACENVPGAAERIAASGLNALGEAKFDRIVSNPPIHDGFREDFGVLHTLIADAPRYLHARGSLVLVVQRRLALDRSLETAFGAIETLKDNGRFRVFKATEPKGADR
jgi:16S rRNA (guanine1207-N2)-methyltransferase